MNEDDDLLYQIAVTMLPGIGSVYARALVEHFGSPEEVFRAKRKELETIEGIGQKRIEGILRFDFELAEKEIEFIRKYRIRPLFFRQPGYPQRLLHCFDSPLMLYYKGTSDLNAAKVVAIVGTRNPSGYGRSVCEKLVEDLSDENILIVSGLAYGIDTIAHATSLKSGIETIGVVAHGLDRIYPAENEVIAKRMTQAGGLLTEFRHGTIPDRMNFPARNRIIAGMSDCVIVIESGIKGGSLITAELGNGYNRDIFAIPGRVSDSKSSGCNYLIRTNKAGLATGAKDILLAMGWEKDRKLRKVISKELFIDLPEEEKKIYDLLQAGPLAIDELYLRCDLSGSVVAQSLLMLEMKGIISSLPGKVYALT